MNAKQLLIYLAAAILLAACGKQKTCVEPYAGDTPLTVVPGLEIGKSFDQIYTCTSVDTSTWKWDEGYEGWEPEFPQGSAKGVYEGFDVWYNLLFADHAAQELKTVYISPTYNRFDTAEVRILRDSVVRLNILKYGSPRLCPYTNRDDYSRHYYRWEICNGVNINIVGTTSVEIIGSSDSIKRDLVLEFTR